MRTLPDWMEGPPAPQPEARGEWFPHIIGQVPDGEGNVLVTFALPDLARATVRVPQSSWLNGDHLTLSPALVRLVTPPKPMPDDIGNGNQGDDTETVNNGGQGSDPYADMP